MKFPDGDFEFYTAHYGSWANDRKIVFRVRSDRDPKERASEKDIKGYDRIYPAIAIEVLDWFRSHETFVSGLYNNERRRGISC